MGNPHESLRAFVRSLEYAPGYARDTAARGVRFDCKTTIDPSRFDLSLGVIEVTRVRDPWEQVPVTYSIPRRKLQAAASSDSQTELNFRLPLGEFVQSLGGTELEIDTSRNKSTKKSNWTDWKAAGMGEVYRQGIYPKAIKEVEDRISSLSSERIVAVDLFGGDGEFVQMMLPTIQSRVISSEVHIIDAHKISLDTARERFVSLGEDVVIVHPPTEIELTSDIFADVPTPPNLVTAIGGLCVAVTTRSEALAIASKVYRGMADNGIFVVTGYSEVLLNEIDFLKIGFKIEQKTIPENALSFVPPYQMYVLRK